MSQKTQTNNAVADKSIARPLQRDNSPTLRLQIDSFAFIITSIAIDIHYTIVKAVY